MQNTAFGVWQNISGSGMLTALYICALVFLFFYEKETYKRILVVYLPMMWLMVLWLPITYTMIAEIIDEELYYRFFWMLPMTLTIAYALVCVYHLYQGRYQKAVFVLLAATVMLCGDFVYDNWRYTKAQNQYHVPQSVVEICDLIHAEGREVMAVFPSELMQYVRQYDGTICMPYGRNVLVSDWKINHELNDIMEAEILDADQLGKVASDADSDFKCVYIIVRTDKETTEDLETALARYGYVWKAQIDAYEVYYNDEIFWSIYR